jgi:3-hydroxyisobutyrate dehydrogenase-like beta-hydroxyacid dehydrogenase
MTHGQTSAGRPARTMETVAVLGAGRTMGFAMARNIARAGIPVRAWNRTRAKAEPLAGAGTRLKLVTNSWVLAVVEAGAETIALAAGLGVDPALFFQAIEGGPFDLPHLKMKARAIAEPDFAPSFRLRLAANGDEDISATYLLGTPEHAA